jgi:OOP family OmpA-OmpF porin
MSKTATTLPTLIYVLVAAFINACSSSPAILEFSDSANPAAELARFEDEMKTANQQQVDVLSPKNFSEAQSNLREAQEGMADKDEGKDVLHDIAQGRAYLHRANSFAELSRSNLEAVTQARRAAIDAGAPGFYPGEFQKADAHLVDVTSDVERNKLTSANEHRAKIQLEYLNLELLAIKQKNLGPARSSLANSIKDGAPKYAVRTLSAVEKEIQETDAYITANRHNDDQISKRSAAALVSANRLAKITKDSKSGVRGSSEELAIKMDSEQKLTREKQAEINAKETELVGKDRELAGKEQELAYSQDQVSATQDANIALVTENSNLSDEQALNARYEAARAQFTKQEAEVYKQGNTLMIRLRGLEFGVAKSSVRGSNFPLLAKVQKVITSFGPSTVTVEGHTDSNGGKSLNEKLSRDRAIAVREYLVSTSEAKNSTVNAVGFGDQKPLSSNKTAGGRAQNRRVDVLIEPKRI